GAACAGSAPRSRMSIAISNAAQPCAYDASGSKGSKSSLMSAWWRRRGRPFIADRRFRSIGRQRQDLAPDDRACATIGRMPTPTRESIQRPPLRVLILSASARTGSLNGRLAALAARQAERSGAVVDVISLRDVDVPSYNTDDELATGIPSG